MLHLTKQFVQQHYILYKRKSKYRKNIEKTSNARKIIRKLTWDEITVKRNYLHHNFAT